MDICYQCKREFIQEDDNNPADFCSDGCYDAYLMDNINRLKTELVVFETNLQESKARQAIKNKQHGEK